MTLAKYHFSVLALECHQPIWSNDKVWMLNIQKNVTFVTYDYFSTAQNWDKDYLWKVFWPKSADDIPRTFLTFFLSYLTTVCAFSNINLHFLFCHWFFLIHDMDILVTTRPVFFCILKINSFTLLLILFNGNFVQII